jgi:hypothetical protein
MYGMKSACLADGIRSPSLAQLIFFMWNWKIQKDRISEMNKWAGRIKKAEKERDKEINLVMI